MKLKKFKITNYKSILDSGWVDVNDDITVLVGKNESGKTSALSILDKITDPDVTELSKVDDWPSSNRSNHSNEALLAQLVYDFNKDEIETIANHAPDLGKIASVQIDYYWNQSWTVRLLPNGINYSRWAQGQVRKLQESLVKCGAPRDLFIEFGSIFVGFGEAIGSLEKKPSLGLLKSIQSRVLQLSKSDAMKFKPSLDIISYTIKTIENDDLAHEILELFQPPTFKYISDQEIYSGKAKLNQVRERFEKNKTTSSDIITLKLLHMGDLNLDHESVTSKKIDKRERQFSFLDASTKISNFFSKNWKQREFDIILQVDGQDFEVLIQDKNGGPRIPFSERSLGFRWFFSFLMQLEWLSHIQDVNPNYTLLLDEPGLHLHPEAQKDLINYLCEFSKEYQTIYSTHLPFMIKNGRFDNIRFVEIENHQTFIHSNWRKSSKESKFTIQAALGTSWCNSLLMGKNNVIVEGISDYRVLEAMKEYLIKNKKIKLSKDFSISYANAASKVPLLASLLLGQDANVAVIFDHDHEGQKEAQRLIEDFSFNKQDIISYKEIYNPSGFFAIEDVFNPEYVLQTAKKMYSHEIKLIETDTRSIASQLADQYLKLGISFKKNDLTQNIVRDISTQDYKMDDISTERFSRLFVKIDSILASWT